MNIEQLSTRYHVRKLTPEDIGIILPMFQGNPLFYRHCPPEPTAQSIVADMAALPPRTTYEDKFYVGFFAGAQLVAVMDLVLNYPNPETAFIGFFMVAAECQGKGLGTGLVSEILACLHAWGYSHTRLAYVKGNPQSKAFWHKNRFAETGVETSTELYTMVVMQRSNQGECL